MSANNTIAPRKTLLQSMQSAKEVNSPALATRKNDTRRPNASFARSEDTSGTILTRQRLILDGYTPLGSESSKWDKKKILRIATTWQFWVLSFGYFFVQSSHPSQQPFYSLWLKAEHHTVYQINVWPTGQSAVGAVTQIIAGMLSDSPLLSGKR
jgi:hypothetical protein